MSVQTPADTYTFVRRMTPLAIIQTLNSFTGKGFLLLLFYSLFGKELGLVYSLILIFALTLLQSVPAILFRFASGLLSDRWPKRYVVMLCKVLEIIFLLAAAWALSTGPVSKSEMLTYFIILAIQDAFTMPALTGLLPETFNEREISRATGAFSSLGILGMTCGFGFVMFASNIWEISNANLTYILAGLALFNFLVSVYITRKTSILQIDRSQAYPASKSYWLGWKELFSNRNLVMSALANALFIGFGITVVSLLGFFARKNLGITDSPSINLFRITPVLGILIGCYFAGILSKRKIELGLIPIGALLVCVFLVLGVCFPGEKPENPTFFTNIMVPGEKAGEMVKQVIEWKICWLASIYFFLAGLSSGLFLVPVRAFYLQHLNPNIRGAGMAAWRSLYYIVLLVVGIVSALFILSSIKNLQGIEAEKIPPVIQGWANAMPNYSVRVLLACIGGLTAIVTFISMVKLPDFAMRFLLLTIGNLCYRVRLTGLENIPERGPVLLLSNHASYIDAILIASCTTRRVNFLMQEEIFKHKFIGWIAGLTGFIKVPGPGKFSKTIQLFDTVKQTLREGHVVCVFPEGTPSHNGQIGKFSHIYEHMIPQDVDVPVLPVNVGRVWGSIFSHFQGPVKLRVPREFPYFATITIGKPMPKGFTAWDARMAVKELSAEDGMQLAPHEHPAHYFLAKYAKFHPFQPIMIDAATGKTFNFFKTYLAAILFSREIRKMNPPDSKYVGVLLPNSTATVLSMFGTLLADKVPCPLNFSTSQEILELSIKKAKIKLILTSRLFLQKVRLNPTPEMVYLEDIAKQVPTWKKIMTMLGIIILPYKELLNMIAPLSYNDNFGEAALLFSSGSTGIPKGVRLSHHNIFSDCYAMTKSMSFDPRRDSIFGNLPMFHSFGLNTGLFLPFIYRCRPMVYVHSPLDANLIGESILKYHCTVLVATPSFLQQYLRKFKPEVFDVLRFVISGAEKLRQDIAEKFHKAVDGRISIVEGYGCTELSPVASINVCDDIMVSGRLSGKPGSIGLCLETIHGQIVDPLTYKPVPPETEGLFFVKGPMVMQGYLDDPEQNKKALIDGFYNTGDIAKMDEKGYVTICGRLSRFSKIAGEMVPHEMVECIINELCGSDERVVAVGSIPDAQKGEALLVLYTDKMPLTPEQIVADLRERSISNLWIPKATNFHLVEKLPILGTGKLDLIALRKVTDEVAAERQAAAGAASK